MDRVVIHPRTTVWTGPAEFVQVLQTFVGSVIGGVYRIDPETWKIKGFADVQLDPPDLAALGLPPPSVQGETPSK